VERSGIQFFGSSVYTTPLYFQTPSGALAIAVNTQMGANHGHLGSRKRSVGRSRATRTDREFLDLVFA
jgi:hypothetical protein